MYGGENKIVPDLSIRGWFSIFVPILSIRSLTNSRSFSDFRLKKMATFQEITLSCSWWAKEIWNCQCTSQLKKGKVHYCPFHPITLATQWDLQHAYMLLIGYPSTTAFSIIFSWLKEREFRFCDCNVVKYYYWETRNLRKTSQAWFWIKVFFCL